MAPTYKIALIQLHPKPLQTEFNYNKAAQFIASAASQGAQLAVLPEYHLTNWIPHDPQFVTACAHWQLYLDRYRALAKTHNICIVPGTIVEHHKDAKTDEEKLTNVAYFIGNDGEVLGQYQKKNLWHPEREHLTSSTYAPHSVIHTPLGPIGLLICWDLAFPEAFRELIAAGAKMIIIPTFWTLADCNPYGLSQNPHSEALFMSSTLTARAFENTCAIVFVNAGGPAPSTSHSDPSSSHPGAESLADATSPYAGLSRVSLPFVGGLACETKESGAEGMSIVDVDMELVEQAEANYKVREDLGRGDWHYEYRHRRMERGK